MNNQVPWTVTYSDEDGTNHVGSLYGPYEVSRYSHNDIIGQLGLSDVRLISMVRGHHSSTAVVFQGDEDEPRKVISG